jgi:hypothetical protein
MAETLGEAAAGAPPAENYWTQSRRPLVSLIFTAPLLILYELGLLALGEHANRNGAEAWLRWLLDRLGFSQYFLLPTLTVCVLLAWHHTTRQPWRVRGGVLLGMTAECALLAVCLRLLLLLQGMVLQSIAAALPLSIADGLGTMTSYLGAGIYEELLFRLILLPLVIGLLTWLQAGTRAGKIGGVVLTSLLFAAAHYIGPYGEALNGFTFLFRFLAGAFFSVLFLYRGFGIAAGTHAAYDLLVGLSLSGS